jgi:hypothetical protein
MFVEFKQINPRKKSPAAHAGTIRNRPTGSIGGLAFLQRLGRFLERACVPSGRLDGYRYRRTDAAASLNSS